MAKLPFNFRITEKEAELIAEYAREMGCSKTDVIRELIRSLRRKLDMIRKGKKEEANDA